MSNNPDLRMVLTRTRRIAIVGASDKPGRASNHVFQFLVARGYDVVGINPALAGQTLHGRPVVASLNEAGPLDMVDIFRAPDQVGPIVDDAIRLGARTIWMQLGVINPAAAAAARAAGLQVVVDRCPAIEWSRLGLPSRLGLEAAPAPGQFPECSRSTPGGPTSAEPNA